jgi:hypothetical protein
VPIPLTVGMILQVADDDEIVKTGANKDTMLEESYWRNIFRPDHKEGHNNSNLKTHTSKL